MPDIVNAAGAVVLRRKAGRPQVLVVHRPKYDDWSLPKGKLDPGESLRAAAVREVEEETGVPIRLGPPLADQAYPLNGGVKIVHWWVGYPKAEHDVSAYPPNDEIGAVRWVSAEDAGTVLSYAHDRDTVAEAVTFGRRTVPLLVLRHAAARDKKSWKKDDRQRPLSAEGKRQADRLPGVLAAYAPERLVSSSSRRCWTTLAAYARGVDTDIEVTDALSQEDATDAGVAKQMKRLVAARRPLVVCSHRPVLPMMFEALGIEPSVLDTAAMAVVHQREGRVAAVERVAAPPRR